MRLYEWNFKKRNELKKLLLQGYKIIEIEKILNVSRHPLKDELKRGLTDSDYTNQRYIKYDPYMAMDTVVKNAVGEEEFKLLMDYWKEQEKKEIKIRNVNL